LGQKSANWVATVRELPGLLGASPWPNVFPSRAFDRFSSPAIVEQWQQNLAPIFDGAMDSANLKPIVCIVYLERFGAAPTAQNVASALLADGRAMPNSDFGLAKPRRVVESIRAFQDFHCQQTPYH
jgi:hypothetical protein